MPHDKLPDPETIIEHLAKSGRGPLKAKELSNALDVPKHHYRDFRELLRELENDGTLYRVKGNRYAVPEKINLAVGRLQVIRSGDAFVVTDGDSEDVFVRESRLESAMDGDRVVARIEGRRRNRNPEGRIIKVLERAHPTVVGTYHGKEKYGFVVPLTSDLTRDVFVPPGQEKEARNEDVVVVRIESYGDRNLNPVGWVEEVLGPIDDPGVDVLSVLYGHGLPLEFPDEVEEAARRAADEKKEASSSERVDRTDLHVFTIDPADAKDHDDALSIAPAGDGKWEVGIHIADVAHFVEEGGPVDLEAVNRGTSVYLVDRVVPMLPHALSSDACSLRPDEDRMALSLFVTLDDQGRKHGHRFERTLIRSRQKLSYEDVQEVLSGEGGIDPETDQAISRLNSLARLIRKDRLERGSLDFDLPEARVILGEEGEPVDIQRVQHLESHRLIEDFMIMANEIVASEGERREIPFVYRVHEKPPDEKAEDLRSFLASVGHTLPKRELLPRDLQNVLQRVRGQPQENLISTVILRSMSKAYYAVENLRHFGLASEHYTHFTSPIRRYPDLMIHRLVIRAFIRGESVPGAWRSEKLEPAAERASERERVAQQAERDSVDLKKVEFMERHLGDEFDGTISGVTSFGFFVLLDEYFVEGLVHVNRMEDDYYEFLEGSYALVGRRSGRRFQLGDQVRIQVARVNKEEREIDFVLAGGS